MIPLAEFLVLRQRLVDAALDRLTPPESALPATIHRAMRYSLFAGGKRIRPLLCLEAAAAATGIDAIEIPGALEAACSIEMIHTYSLIHDDLPALDNDDYRRGKPTCHKVFGEAMAILAGDALFTLAIQTLAKIEGLDPARQLGLITELSFASGTVEGMIGGQVTDIEGERQPPTAELLDRIHRAKTGALLRASVRMGGICGGADDAGIHALSAYGEHVGLAFQIVDDILDIEESSEALGKTAGKDVAQGKITFPSVYGLDTSRAMAAEQCRNAHEALARFGGNACRLHEIADLIVRPKILKANEIVKGMDKQRLDRWMVEHGAAESREKAQALIMAGEVLVDGRKAAKAGQPIASDAKVDVLAKPRYVGRGGLKLEGALAHFAIDVAGLVCADFGSSTGGFTDCLLQNGAARVFAIDVGTGQLDWKLRNDPRVTVLEGVNARYLELADVGRTVDLAVCDVSFISATLILPAMLRVLKPEAGRLIVLVKPQFEVGKGQVGKGGIVRDPALHEESCGKIREFVEHAGFRTDMMESPITGAEGNREFLLYGFR